MLRWQPKSTRTAQLLPYTTVFRSWRLCYVALTRAEDVLVVAGSLGPRARGQVPEESWYAAVASAMDGLGAEVAHSSLWEDVRSEEHTSELQSLMRTSYAVFCLTNKKKRITTKQHITTEYSLE